MKREERVREMKADEKVEIFRERETDEERRKS
jgi:hypothetical protein